MGQEEIHVSLFRGQIIIYLNFTVVGQEKKNLFRKHIYILMLQLWAYDQFIQGTETYF